MLVREDYFCKVFNHGAIFAKFRFERVIFEKKNLSIA
jgi:hypothetical protein